MPERSIASTLALLAMFVTVSTTTAEAQELSRLGVDSVVAIDQFVGQNAADRPNIVVDISAVVRIGAGWRAFVRPWFRQPRTSEWDKEIYQAFIQYERPGKVSTRVDLGYLASPIGLGIMDSRPGVNPVIGGHSVYFSSLPAFEPSAPRVSAIASTYPLGAQLTTSTARWDIRGALVNSSPTRAYVINRDGPPQAAPTVESGVGFTPRTGTRIGASFALGEWATAAEVPRAGEGRTMTMAGLEGELAVGYTKIAGEVVRTDFETFRGQAIAYSWFVQAMQTLAPRWVVAARAGRRIGAAGHQWSAGGPAIEAAGSRSNPRIRLNPDLPAADGRVVSQIVYPDRLGSAVRRVARLARRGGGKSLTIWQIAESAIGASNSDSEIRILKPCILHSRTHCQWLSSTFRATDSGTHPSPNRGDQRTRATTA